MRNLDTSSIVGTLGSLHFDRCELGQSHPDFTGSSPVRDRLRKHLEVFCQAYSAVDLSATVRQAQRIVSYIDNGATNRTLGTLCDDLNNAVIDELKTNKVIILAPHELTYYEGDYYDRSITDRFPEVEQDLVYAGRSLTLGLYTATVFHLMRVIEVGLLEFAESAKVKMPDNRNWGILLGVLEDAKADPEIIERMRAIKDIWRNPTLHVERNYAKIDAAELVQLVVPFMRILAARI